MRTIAARSTAFVDADVAALLSLAMNATSKERKAAALVLAEAMRKATPIHEALGTIAAEAGGRYGEETAVQVHAIALELHLN